MLANIPRLQDLMKRDNLDAVIATCPENVTYLSGFWAMSQWVRRGPQAYVLFPGKSERPCIIANSGILDLVPDQQPWITEIRRYGYFIEEYRLTPNGCCPDCGNSVPGRWAEKFEGQIADRPFVPGLRTNFVTLS